jgi:hypothetical protein
MNLHANLGEKYGRVYVAVLASGRRSEDSWLRLQGGRHAKHLAAITHHLPASAGLGARLASGEDGRTPEAFGYGGGGHCDSEKHRL